MRIFRHQSVQVFLSVAIYLSVAHMLPMYVHQALFTVSLGIKDLLLWLLPLTVGFFIAHAIALFEKKAPLFLLVLVLFEAVSNALSVWYSYLCGHIVQANLPGDFSGGDSSALTPLWRMAIEMPVWWSAEKGVLVGVLVGLLAAFMFPSMREVVKRGKVAIEFILTRFFSRLIPFFVLGFVARMYKSEVLGSGIGQYGEVFLWLVVFLVGYILVLFFVGSQFSFKRCALHIKNMLPAAGIAFSSGCSLSAMPWTIRGSSKNGSNPEIAKAVIPATTNIQQIGDCIANSLLCFLIYVHFFGAVPSFGVWAMFSVMFVLARFATAAVLGGAIFIMLPVYENYLGFTPEMIAMILAFNVILDPLITSSNVIANGALCTIFEKVWAYYSIKSKLDV